MFDFGSLSEKQREIVEKIWGVCVYFQAARRYAPDSVLAQQAGSIGSMVDDFDKEESKKIKSGVAGKVG